jgi:membrane associated rhomboid family serine protease
MTSGADLFVVCKQCGSEVSPYITECPYCGNRLRRRAPKLPPVNARPRTLRGRARSLLSSSGSDSEPMGATLRPRTHRPSRWAADRPYVTMGLVAASATLWVLVHAEPNVYEHLALQGPLRGDWWKLLTNPFVYADGLYAFVAILTVAIFGWLLELRHGSAAVLALFLGATVVGGVLAEAVYLFPFVSGANAAALALVAAWAAPDVEAARKGRYRDGDLLGAAALAALLLAMPFAFERPEASWLAGVAGGVLGLLVGLGLHRLSEVET